MDQLSQLLLEQRDAMALDIAERIKALNLPAFRYAPTEQLAESARQFTEAFVTSLDGESQAYQQLCATLGMRQVELGTSVDSTLELFKVSDTVIIEQIKKTAASNPAAALDDIERVALLSSDGRRAMFDSYISAREEVIERQRAALSELRTPIIPVREGILVLPIVGAIDSHRAGQIIEAALEQITAQQADILIIDITGVPVVDTGVANYLIQTARAVRLLGAQVILVGISAAIAQAIVSLGIDMRDITPRANLQSAIEQALAGQGLAILPMAEPVDSEEQSV